MKLIIILSMLFVWPDSNAQRIKVGEKCPDIELANVINYEKSKIKLSEFKGKLVILDFWSTGCSSCIEAFSHMDSLQSRFKDDIQIILVNKESADSTLHFFFKRKRITKPSLPFVTNDKRLSSFFRNDFYPYSVWIDKNRVVRSFTYGRNTTKEAITKFLASDHIALKDISLKKRIVFGSAISSGNLEIEKKFEYYSYITKCIEDLDVGHARGLKVNNGKSIRLASNCSSIVELYKKAYEEGDKYNFNFTSGVFLDISDTFKFTRPADNNIMDAWIEKNAFNYDLVLPIERAPELYEVMKQDLNRYFNLKAIVEKRKVRAMILVRRNESYSPNMFDSPDPDNLKRYKVVVNGIRNIIESNLSVPFIDETNYGASLQIDLEKDSINPFDLLKFRSYIQKYDLDLVEADREVYVLVLSDRQ